MVMMLVVMVMVMVTVVMMVMVMAVGFSANDPIVRSAALAITPLRNCISKDRISPSLYYQKALKIHLQDWIGYHEQSVKIEV